MPILSWTYYLVVPYNIKTNGGLNWKTGLHIKMLGHETAGETLKVVFSSESSEYANFQIDVDDFDRGNWTGFVEQLLEEGAPSADFESPTFLHFYSRYHRFTVTQFIMSDTGFGHQTFHSWPVDYNDQWIYPPEVAPVAHPPEVGR
jgi:hypothetical protein